MRFAMKVTKLKFCVFESTSKLIFRDRISLKKLI